ncbi:hypothetical protein E8E11_009772 [Didymella keratinophila]|nr:hypothetical protein E8E11_009772 [Didymella keratinophila]
MPPNRRIIAAIFTCTEASNMAGPAHPSPAKLIGRCGRALCLAMWKLEKLEQRRRLTQELVEAVQSKIIDHILAARRARAQLDPNVVDILNRSVNEARVKLECPPNHFQVKWMDCWRKRVAACAEKYNWLASQPLRENMEDRLPQELCGMVYEQVALLWQR